MKTFIQEFPLPNGVYETKIAQVSPINEKWFTIVFEVTEGDHAGHKAWKDVNFNNPYQTRKLLVSVDLESIDNTDQLLGRNCQIEIKPNVREYKTHRTFEEIYGFPDLRSDLLSLDNDQIAKILKKVETLVEDFGFDREYAILRIAYDQGYSDREDDEY